MFNARRTLLIRRLRPLLNLTSEQVLLTLALFLGLVFTLLFFYTAGSRLSYPFDIEWMEGGVITHAKRLLDGQPLYAKPSADFIAYIYQPLFYVLLAGLGTLSELSVSTGRIISL